MILKEVCVDNLSDAINAYKCGANRIEFCSYLDLDGLTPKINELLTLSNTIHSFPTRRSSDLVESIVKTIS